MEFKYDIKYFDTKEVALTWGVTQRTITSYCRQKLLPKAYKESNTWKIPEGSIKPLNSKETKDALFLISKIHSYLSIDHEQTSKELDSLQSLSPILNYLESFGYITYTKNSSHITQVLITEKGYNLMKKGKGLSITVEVSSVINLVSAILKLVIVLGSN